MHRLRLAAVEADTLIFNGLPEHPQLAVSLHSSARMRLLGSRVDDFDPSDPEVLPRIERAVMRLLEEAPLAEPSIELTALDLD